MDIVVRNFLRLLRSGVFSDDTPIEPMSCWKWQRLWQLSLMHGVAPLVADGIEKRGGEFLMNIPEAQRLQWKQSTAAAEERGRQQNGDVSALLSVFQQDKLRPILMKGQAIATLYPKPLHRTVGDCDIYFPFATQASKATIWARTHGDRLESPERGVLRYRYEGMVVEHHRRLVRLANMVLNTWLQSIIRTEIGSCDSSYVLIGTTRVETLPPALNLLGMIVRTARYLYNEGISMKQLVDMGVFLRKVGGKVDYVKLQKWIDTTKLSDLARLEGSLLVDLLNFSEDEIPFMEGKKTGDTKAIADNMFTIGVSHPNEWYSEQEKSVFFRAAGSSEVGWRLANVRRHFGYCPSEAIANIFSSIAHSLSNVEE